ncbi:MAG: hypothetical protein M2R45_03814 [Verrucomicrobia subdivision 3 bacterium]|nr:hypothetical protein [Limisphaerales bacterium]MCS1415770.1 hypothetical protein [Limisphaerales bacterium]
MVVAVCTYVAGHGYTIPPVYRDGSWEWTADSYYFPIYTSIEPLWEY